MGRKIVENVEGFQQDIIERLNRGERAVDISKHWNCAEATVRKYAALGGHKFGKKGRALVHSDEHLIEVMKANNYNQTKSAKICGYNRVWFVNRWKLIKAKLDADEAVRDAVKFTPEVV